jgi:fructokinase
MDRPLLIGLGELLWDVLPHGEQLGGAPANFSYHAAALGAEGFVVSTVGRDLRGELALRELVGKGLPIGGIAVSDGWPTGYVEAKLDGQGVASYHFPDDVAWDHLIINGTAEAAAQRAAAVCFGSLCQRSADSRRAIERFLGQMPASALKIFDVNLRQHFYSEEILRYSLDQADVVKLNDDELPVVAGLFHLTGGPQEQLLQLRRRFGLRLVILTRGGQGSLLVTAAEVADHPGVAAGLVDTIGAGDSFTAAATVGLLRGMSLAEIGERANRLAAFVCSHAGAMPAIPAEYRLIRQPA